MWIVELLILFCIICRSLIRNRNNLKREQFTEMNFCGVDKLFAISTPYDPLKLGMDAQTHKKTLLLLSIVFTFSRQWVSLFAPLVEWNSPFFPMMPWKSILWEIDSLCHNIIEWRCYTYKTTNFAWLKSTVDWVCITNSNLTENLCLNALEEPSDVVSYDWAEIIK